MRIWLVKIEELSDLHVLGQHREWHMLHAMIHNPRFKTHPLVLFYKDKKAWLANFHDRLVAEMHYRWEHDVDNHLTPVPSGYNQGQEVLDIPAEWVQFDVIDLSNRYQKAPTGKYKWTKRPVPHWATDKDLLLPSMAPIPLYVKMKPEVWPGEIRA